MQGYFKKKTQNTPRPSEHPPVVGGGNKHRIHEKLGIQMICSLLSCIKKPYLDLEKILLSGGDNGFS